MKNEYTPPPMAYMPNQDLSKKIQEVTGLNQPQAPEERPSTCDCDPAEGMPHPAVQRG